MSDCIDCGDIQIGKCAPYANRADVVSYLSELCKSTVNCFFSITGSVAIGDIEAYLIANFPNYNTVDNCCSFHMVVTTAGQVYVRTEIATWLDLSPNNNQIVCSKTTTTNNNASFNALFAPFPDSVECPVLFVLYSDPTTVGTEKFKHQLYYAFNLGSVSTVWTLVSNSELTYLFTGESPANVTAFYTSGDSLIIAGQTNHTRKTAINNNRVFIQGNDSSGFPNNKQWSRLTPNEKLTFSYISTNDISLPVVTEAAHRAYRADSDFLTYNSGIAKNTNQTERVAIGKLSTYYTKLIDANSSVIRLNKRGLYRLTGQLTFGILPGAFPSEAYRHFWCSVRIVERTLVLNPALAAGAGNTYVFASDTKYFYISDDYSSAYASGGAGNGISYRPTVNISTDIMHTAHHSVNHGYTLEYRIFKNTGTYWVSSIISGNTQAMGSVAGGSGSNSNGLGMTSPSFFNVTLISEDVDELG